MKSLMRLLECVLADASSWCSTSTTRDFETISRRVKYEGISFLTITLPTFGKDFERSLAKGMVDPVYFQSFRKYRSLPCLFRGLTSQVFDLDTGTLLARPSVDAIYAVRQICYFAKKVLINCSDERMKGAFDGYARTNDECRLFDERFWSPVLYAGHLRQALERACLREVAEGLQAVCGPHRDLLEQSQSRLRDPAHLGLSSFRESARHLYEVGRLLWGSSLQSAQCLVHSGAIVPRHGPGATAEKISGNQKYNLQTWHSRLEQWFPSDQFCIPNSGYAERLESIEFVNPGAERPVRVVAVPKTLKTPRIIAIEPVCMQYTQQALMHCLVEALENSPLTAGKVNFTDQTINQNLARSSSIDGRYATIDLKDASDRVSSRTAWVVLDSVPILRDAIFACRSLRSDVPGHGVQPVYRFASMGSALCFPVEAMVFYTIALSAIIRSEGTRITLKTLQKASEGVRVYGDDIIVPVEYVQVVKDELAKFNLRVNGDKTFETGKFRESCGLDAYDGIDVTPVYVRRLLPTSHQDVEGIVSAVSLANQLYFAGYWRSCMYVRSVCESFANFPYVAQTSSILGWHSHTIGYEAHAWSSTLHRWLTRGKVLKIKHRPSRLDGEGALMKYFLKRGTEPYHDARHLERSGRPLSVYTKTRWACPY